MCEGAFVGGGVKAHSVRNSGAAAGRWVFAEFAEGVARRLVPGAQPWFSPVEDLPGTLRIEMAESAGHGGPRVVADGPALGARVCTIFMAPRRQQGQM